MKYIRLTLALLTLITTIAVIGSRTIGIADEGAPGPKCDCRYMGSGAYGVQGLNEDNEWTCIVVDCWLPLPG